MWAKATSLRSKAEAQALAGAPRAEAGEPESLADTITDRELAEARQLLPLPELRPGPGKKSFDLQAEIPSIFEQVARAYSLEAVVDQEYPKGQPYRFRIGEASFAEAVYALETATGSFITPLGERRFLVAKDTGQKRQEFERTIAVTIPLPEPVSAQEIQEVARTVQQVMEIQRFAIDGTRRLALMRGPLSKVRPAQALFTQLLHHRPEVSIEVELLTVRKNYLRTIGLRLPSSFPLVWLSELLGPTPKTLPPNFHFFAFGGGLTYFGIGLSSAEAVATMEKSEGRNLARAEMRSVDGQPASMHIGDRYPVVTSGFLGTPPKTSGGDVYIPPPAFTFEDLGLILKVTPRTHGKDEVTLEVEAEFKLLTGAAVNSIPVIATRKFNSRVRVPFGDAAILGGLMAGADAKSLSGIAGLARIPGLGPLFRTETKSADDSETLLVLKPRLLSLPPTETVPRAVWTGTDTRGATLAAGILQN